MDEQTSQVVRTGNLSEEGIGTESQRRALAQVANLPCQEVVSDEKGNRVFLLLAVPQSDQLYGYVVFQLSPPKLLEVLKADAPLDAAHLLVNPSGTKIYISYSYRGNQSPPVFAPETRIYDSASYKVLRVFKNPSFYLRPWSCFLGDDEKLFTNRQIFSASTGELIRKTRLFGKLGFQEVECRNGHLLSVSKGTDGSVVATLYDPQTDETVREIRTGVPFHGFATYWKDPQWTLAADGSTVIYDFRGRGDGNTTALRIFDGANGSLRGEVKLRLQSGGSSVLGTSSDGRLLFYGSSSTLYVVDLKDLRVVKEVVVPFKPMSVAWNADRAQ